jgi:hypothetical protein
LYPIGRRRESMPKFKGKIKGTISDDFEVEAENEAAAIEAALMGWSYVEFQDLDVESIAEISEPET